MSSLSRLFIATLVMVAGCGWLPSVASQATTQDPSRRELPRRAGRVRATIDNADRLLGTPDRIIFSGTTTAPGGSEVIVEIAGQQVVTEVDEAGSWIVRWGARLEPGQYEVNFEIRAQQGRSWRGTANLTVEAAPAGGDRSGPADDPPPTPPEAMQPVPSPDAIRGGPEDFQEFTDRWRIAPPPYELNAKKRRVDPYNQNVLKGDFPINGKNLFFVLTAISDTLVEPRSLPTPSGVSTTGTGFDFFGADEQFFGVQNALVSFEFFKGDTAFKPPGWRIKGTFAGNYNYLDTKENAVVNPDVREGDNRTDDFGTLQEFFVEKRLAKLSSNFDFLSVRIGSQPFTSDFRGFIFSDTNLGFRLFGNAADNRYQYNLAYFDRLEKDTNSGLNKLEFRDQQVTVFNLYRQDTFVRGHTVEFSIHRLEDDATFIFDENGFLSRPDAAGDFTPHGIDAWYFGLASFGKFGRINVDSAFYYVTGDDELNPIAGRQLVALDDGEFAFLEEVDISAYQAALELSVDSDWWRPKVALFYASGDDDVNDRDAEGFDAIFDNPNFAGGGFSFWNRAGIRLAGSGVTLVNRGSLLPDLSSSKEEGQPNFVNPGLWLASLGFDLELTPKLRAVLTANYLRFDETEVLEGLLFQDEIDHEIGLDLSVGFRHRPFLNQNVVILGGVAGLVPGSGYKDIYENRDSLYQVFANVMLTY